MTLPGIQYNHNSGIVNGYQLRLLCDAHTGLEPHKGTVPFFYFAHCRPFPLFFSYCYSDSPISFLGCLFSLCK